MAKRLLLYETGEVVACFEDGRSVVLEDAGEAFTCIQGDAACRHLTRYCPNALRKHVGIALRFRNTYAARPFLCEAAEAGDEAATPATAHARWTSEALAIRSDGSVLVQAMTGNASLVLSPLGEEATARFKARIPGTSSWVWVESRFPPWMAPTCFKHPVSMALEHRRRRSDKNEHALNASASTFNGEEQEPLREEALPQPEPRPPYATWSAVSDADARSDSCGIAPPPAPMLRIDISQLAACGPRHHFGSLAPILERCAIATLRILYITGRQASESGVLEWAELSNATAPSSCPTGGCSSLASVHSLENQRQRKERPKVLVQVHADASVLLLDGDFVRHCRRPGSDCCSPEPANVGDATTAGGRAKPKAAVYHVSAAAAVRVSYLVRSPLAQRRDLPAALANGACVVFAEYSLAPLVSLALRLRAQYERVTAAAAANKASRVQVTTTAAALRARLVGSEVRARASTPLGDFTAFQDGRVSAIFRDRTLLHLSADGSTCRAVLPDGKETVATVRHSGELAAYLAAAAHFSRWAKAEPEQRRAMAGAEAAARTRAAAAAAQAQRFVKIEQILKDGNSGASLGASPWATATREAALAAERRTERFLRECSLGLA